jgi:putative pyruvate formate lyase activating enzyme
MIFRQTLRYLQPAPDFGFRNAESEDMQLNMKEMYDKVDQQLLSCCTLCPRECGVDRYRGGTGICATDAGLNIASICIHRGEEPVISGSKGICNIFFEGCSLNCIYCQNHEISHPCRSSGRSHTDLSNVLDQICRILETGINAVGFVTPSHVVPQVKAIINGLHSRGFRPVAVYNTSSYDRVETLRSLTDIIDVYLPDFKYVTSSLSSEYSGAADYPSVALKALREMYYQKGSVLRVDEAGNAEWGMLIRHLVLPGHAEESIRLLETIADELSTGVHLSLMSQYHPSPNVRYHQMLNRPLSREEYEKVVTAMERLGFRNGWVQGMDSSQNYLPDFRKDHPFEH